MKFVGRGSDHITRPRIVEVRESEGNRV